MEYKNIKPISLNEAKKYMKDIKEKTATYEQIQALEYMKEFACAKEKKGIREKLKKAVDKLDEETIIKLIDIMPKLPETVKAICTMNKIALEDNEVEEIIKILNSDS